MNVLEQVVTLQEAAQAWGIDDSTLRHAIKNSRFENNEIKKSSNTWLILRSGMLRLYGKENQLISLSTIGYEGYTVEGFIEKLKENRIDILVAPIIEKGARVRKLYLPEGLWQDQYGVIYHGGSCVEVTAKLSWLPWFRKNYY